MDEQNEALEKLFGLAYFDCGRLDCKICPCWSDKYCTCVSTHAQELAESWVARHAPKQKAN